MRNCPHRLCIDHMIRLFAQRGDELCSRAFKFMRAIDNLIAYYSSHKVENDNFVPRTPVTIDEKSSLAAASNIKFLSAYSASFSPSGSSTFMFIAVRDRKWAYAKVS